ncbi:MAG: RNA pseudouridine synthase [Myxococcota bacterium]|nr:RNA pseudouridine synthase [Myxococcota bacterium]
MKLLFSDPDWLVVDKPAGWLTVPGRPSPQSPPVLRARVEAEHGPVWVVHRLDRQVGGLILFARTPQAHRRASLAFESREVSKTYQAKTVGQAPKQAKQRFLDRLKRGKKRVYPHAQGKDCETRARCLGPVDGGLGWELNPVTGRNHQLRVQLAQRGWPILGDVLYGGPESEGEGIALRSVALSTPFGDFSAPPLL